MNRRDLQSIEVIVPSLSRRFSGVTATFATLVPFQAKKETLATFGWHAPAGVPALSLFDLLRLVLLPPGERGTRIWHARRNNEMLLGLLLKLLARGRLKLVMTSAIPRPPSWISRFLIRRMDRLIIVRKGVQAFLERPADAIIPHGVDCNLFTPAENREALWQSLTQGGKQGICCFGRLRPSKGTDLFVRTMIEVLPDFPDFTAVIIGLTRPKDRAFVEGLKSEVLAAGLKERIRFFGFADALTTRKLYAAASLVISPSRQEGFGLTPIEAMASGTPVVASDAGAYPDLLAGLDCGGVFKKENIDQLVLMTRQSLDSMQSLTSMGAKCRQHVVQHHKAEIEAESIHQIYADLWSETE